MARLCAWFRRRKERQAVLVTGNGQQHIAAVLNRFFEQQRRERQEDIAREKERSRRELYTLAGVWVYTLITAGIAAISLYQASIFKETEKRQLRAYVATSPVLITCCDDADPRKDIIKIPMENTGQTPAYFLDSFLKRFQLTIDDAFPEDFGCIAHAYPVETQEHQIW